MTREDGGPAAARQPDPAAEHLVVAAHQLVQDAAVQLQGGPDAGLRGWREQLHAGQRGLVVGAGPGALEGEQVADRGAGFRAAQVSRFTM